MLNFRIGAITGVCLLGSSWQLAQRHLMTFNFKDPHRVQYDTRRLRIKLSPNVQGHLNLIAPLGRLQKKFVVLTSKVVLVRSEHRKLMLSVGLRLNPRGFWNFYNSAIKLVVPNKKLNVFFEFFIVNHQHNLRVEKLNRLKQSICFTFVLWRKSIDNRARRKQLWIGRRNHFQAPVEHRLKLIQIILLLPSHCKSELLYLLNEEFLSDYLRGGMEHSDCLVQSVARQCRVDDGG